MTEVQPGACGAPLQRPRDEQQRVLGHEESFERRRFRHEPPALEGIGAGRLADAHVVFGEQPPTFVAHVADVAPQPAERQLQRKDGCAAVIVGPGTL